MPCKSTVFEWLQTSNEFQELYRIAMEQRADAHIEECLDISDDGSNDWMEMHDKDGKSVGWKVNGEHIQRSRLRVDTRKWIAGKMRPKKYGEKIAVAGDPDAPPVAIAITKIERVIVKPDGSSSDSNG